jgi:hypothetical protein
MSLLLAVFLVFVLVMAAMAVGVIFSNITIKGSCGGLGALAAKVGLPLCECGGDPEKCKRNREEPETDDEPSPESLVVRS